MAGGAGGVGVARGGEDIKWILLQFQKEAGKFQLLIFPLEISACIFIYYKHIFMTRIILGFLYSN